MHAHLNLFAMERMTQEHAMRARTDTQRQRTLYTRPVTWRAVLATALLLIGSTQTILAKDVPGAAPTSWGVGANGAFQFSVPIIVPAGRNGVQPNLSISFSSGGGNGLMGVGWGVSGLGAITRCGKTHATNDVRDGVDHDADDRFCMNGQQLIRVEPGTYGADGTEYRTELESFAKITAIGSRNNLFGGTAPESWEVRTKDGAIYYYGAPAGVSEHTAQFELPGTNSIHHWNLASMEDRSGNYYEVSYHQNNGRPNEIEYTKKNGVSTGQKVSFVYDEQPARTDTRFGYVLGKRIDRDNRLDRIEVTSDNTVVREYSFAYETAPETGLTRLTSITECGQDSTCMPAIDVQWQAETAGYQSTTATTNKSPYNMIDYYTFNREMPAGVPDQPNSVKQINRGTWADVNGDGRVDQVIAYTKPDGTTVKLTYLNTTAGWIEDSTWHLPRPLRSYENDIVNNPVGRFRSDVINMGQMVDVDGDGLVDVVYSYKLDKDRHQYGDPNNPISDIEEIKKTYINNGNGWDEDPAWAPKDLIYDYLSNGSLQTVRGRLIDLNGDGLPDWVSAWSDYISGGVANEVKSTWINNGGGWDYNANYIMKDVFVQFRGVYSIPHGQFVDVNGDGLPDWVKAYHASTETAQFATYLNTGTGFSNDNPQYHLPELLYDNLAGWNDAVPHTRGSFIDVNGDGLRDYVKSYHTSGGADHRKTYLNTGNGWVADTSYNPQWSYIDHRYSDFERGWPLNVRGNYIDLNRDGLVDYVEAYKSSATGFPVTLTAWINNGDGFDEVAQGSEYDPTEIYYDYSGRDNAKANVGDFLDINFDGAPDWVKSSTEVSNSTFLHKTARANELASITTTMGVMVKPTFEPLTAGSSVYDKYPAYDNQALTEADDALIITAPLRVTTSLDVTRPDDATQFNTSTYKYGGMQVHRKGRGNLGFFLFESTNALGITSRRYAHQEWPLTGRTFHATTEQDNLSGTTVELSKVENVYSNKDDDHGGEPKTVFVFMESSTSTQRELTSNAVVRVQKRELEFDDGGIDYTYGNVTLDTTTTKDGNQTVLNITEVDPRYKDADDATWLVGLVDKVIVTTKNDINDPAPKVRETDYAYKANGLLEVVHVQPNDPQALNTQRVTTLGYDTFGNLTTETVKDPFITDSDRTTTIDYDGEFRLPKEFTNALTNNAHKTKITAWDEHCDLPATVQDANDLNTLFEYDDFCRETKVTDAAGIWADTAYLLDPGDGPSSAKFKITAGAKGQDPIYTYLDHYGQGILSSTLSMDDRTVQATTSYNQFGLVVSETEPHFVGDTTYATSYAYDALNRMEKVTLPYTEAGSGTNAEVTYAYGVETGTGYSFRSVTDQLQNTTTSYANALGQIKRVRDANGKDLTYDYDSQGNLSKTTDAAAIGNSIELTYDTLGRRIELDDPDLGVSTFAYTAFGELASQTDAKGQIISMEYDNISRLIKRTVPEVNGNNGGVSKWVWDTGNKGKGAIHKVLSFLTDPNDDATARHQVTYDYDGEGRLKEKSTDYANQTFKEKFSYNTDNGFLAKRQYPSSGQYTGSGTDPYLFEVEYDYEGGYLESIKSTADSYGQCIEHWSVDEYDALGRVTQETLGRLVQTHRNYKGGQNVLSSIQSNIIDGPMQGTAVQDLAYTYDAVNNVKVRENKLTSVLEEFDYDNLHRLTKYFRTDPNQNGGAKTLKTEVTYNEIGNITYKSDVGDYNYGEGGAGPHAVTSIDNAVAASSEFNINWEWQGDPTQNTATAPGLELANSTFTYDDNGNITNYGNRTFEWTAFDKPRGMYKDDGQGGHVGSQMLYDGEFNRILKQEGEFNALLSPTQVKETTVYIGKYYEQITDANNNVTHRYTINVGGSVIQIERDDGSSTDKPKYLLADNLGSTNVIIDNLGQDIQTLDFDPWGANINAGTQPTNGITNRGFTGHEMDVEVGVVNMNARIYDPYLGRFLSADPVLPDPGDMQQYNRYSYVSNNPLRYVDPTGFSQSANECQANPNCREQPEDNSSGGNSGNDGSGNSSGTGKPMEEQVVTGCKKSCPTPGVSSSSGPGPQGFGGSGFSDGGSLGGGSNGSGSSGVPVGVGEIEVNLVEDTGQFEDDGSESLDDPADEINDAREREGRLPSGRLRDRATRDRENAERDYLHGLGAILRDALSAGGMLLYDNRRNIVGFISDGAGFVLGGSEAILGVILAVGGVTNFGATSALGVPLAAHGAYNMAQSANSLVARLHGVTTTGLAEALGGFLFGDTGARVGRATDQYGTFNGLIRRGGDKFLDYVDTINDFNSIEEDFGQK